MSLLIVVAGLVSMVVLPVAQYPTITPVQVQVTTTYPGADAKTVGDSVASPIEAQINGVDNMLYMTSISSNTGQLTITVYFTLDTDPDMAQVQVQNRVNLALPQLPEAVTQYGVSVQKKSASILMIVALFDKEGRYTPEYVTNYTNVYVLDAIKRVERRRPGADLRRARPGHAPVDEPEPHGLARHHHHRYRERRSPARTRWSAPGR